MKTLLCCIARKANQYILEYVEYYKQLGFSHIVIYDNNYDGEEYFDEILNDYINEEFVTIINYRNMQKAQINAYHDCWNKYKLEYDWIAFFDVDEFLTFTKDKTITQFLSNDRFTNKNAIVINWMCYGDNNLTINDGSGVLERFITPSDYNVKTDIQQPENNHIKSIIKTNNITINFRTPHNINISNQVTASGKERKLNSCFEPYDYTEAYLRHYSTRTIDEYCDKMMIGVPDRLWDKNKQNIEYFLVNKFFKINTPTIEKIEIVKNKLGIDLSYLL